MKVLVLIFVFILSSCASLMKDDPTWYGIKRKDSFTDHETCTVTTGRYYHYKGDIIHGQGYFPFIVERSGGLVIGVKSGRVRDEVGEVTFRVDKNEAWTIETKETPLSFVPSSNTYDNPTSDYQVSLNNIARSHAPYTVATGDKAQAIIKQMLNGATLLYRTVNSRNIITFKGDVPLDESLKNALKACNITIDEVG